MRKNTLKQKLKNGGFCSGVFLGFDDPSVASIIARSGFDWVLIDTEHGHFTTESVRAVMNAMQGAEATVIVRVADDSMAKTKEVLELGAEGVLAPMILDKAQTERVIDNMLYPPKGSRSTGFSRSNMFGLDTEYWKKGNDELLTMLMIENIKTIENIDSILSVPGVDVAFIGPYDLAASMGHVGGATHPEVIAAIDKVIASCKKNKVICGQFCASLEQAQAQAAKGIQMLCFVTDYFIVAREAMRLGAIKLG